MKIKKKEDQNVNASVLHIGGSKIIPRGRVWEGLRRERGKRRGVQD